MVFFFVCLSPDWENRKSWQIEFGFFRRWRRIRNSIERVVFPGCLLQLYIALPMKYRFLSINQIRKYLNRVFDDIVIVLSHVKCMGKWGRQNEKIWETIHRAGEEEVEAVWTQNAWTNVTWYLTEIHFVLFFTAIVKHLLLTFVDLREFQNSVALTQMQYDFNLLQVERAEKHPCSTIC